MRLDTTYLGLQLRNPLVASAGPLSQTVTQVQKLADAGVGAVVLHSLFEEELRNQAERDAWLIDVTSDSYAEALSYFPKFDEQPESWATSHLRLIEQATQAVDVPVIASLNGSTLGSWVQYATRLQNAGAAAIECNIYFVPGDMSLTGEQVEQRHLEIAQAVADAVSIPVAIKLGPQFSSFGDFALKLAATGVKGLVLFNRSLQPDIDIDDLSVVPGVTLSQSSNAILPRAWIAALRNQLPDISLAASSGVETYADVAKYLFAGADVVMTTSALIRNKVSYIETLLSGLADWATAKGYDAIDAFRGLLAVPADAEAGTYQRAGYVAALQRAKTTYGSLAD